MATSIPQNVSEFMIDTYHAIGLLKGSIRSYKQQPLGNLDKLFLNINDLKSQWNDFKSANPGFEDRYSIIDSEMVEAQRKADKLKNLSLCVHCKLKPKFIHKPSGFIFDYCGPVCYRAAKLYPPLGLQKKCVYCKTKPRYSHKVSGILLDYCGTACSKAAKLQKDLQSKCIHCKARSKFTDAATGITLDYCGTACSKAATQAMNLQRKCVYCEVNPRFIETSGKVNDYCSSICVQNARAFRGSFVLS